MSIENEPLDIFLIKCQIRDVSEKGINIAKLPALKTPLLIAGFDGWGNALDISNAMVSYLIRKLKTEYFAKINPDLFYRYDETRPFVNIESGVLIDVSPPGGSFYATQTGSNENDLVILKANEPNLGWFHFVDELFSLCMQLGVKTIITLGSIYDNVLHSDRIVSGIASNTNLLSKFSQKNIIPINYQGPSTIHSTIHLEGEKRGFQCIGLWCHCPYYLEGTTHFGLLSYLGSLLSYLGNFELDTEEIEKKWKELNKQIEKTIEKNPELHAMINEARKAKIRGSWASMKKSGEKDEKIIYLKDFFKPT